MNRPSLSSLALLALALALPACGGIPVTEDHAPGIDFAIYETYAWREAPPSGEAEGDAARARIRSAVDLELAAKGLRAVLPQEARLLLSQRIAVQQKLKVNDPYFAYEAVETYEEGTLVLDFVDARTEKLVWRGTGQGRLKPKDSPAERHERIDRVVAAILAQYPPSAR